MIAGRIVQGDGAVTYTTFAPGLSIRTTPVDRGLSAGFSRRACLADATNYAAAPGWHILSLPPVPALCYALDTATVGLEVRGTAVDTSVALGLRLTTTLAGLIGNGIQDYEMRFDAGRDNAAFLRVHSTGVSQ